LSTFDDYANLLYNVPMITDDYTSIRIWKQTLRLLRIAAAIRGEKMVAMLHRLVKEEYERVLASEPQVKQRLEKTPRK
jgi:hypothetical protein